MYSDSDEPTLLETALGRWWTADDATRLMERMDHEVETLGADAVDLYKRHFCDVLSDPTPVYQGAIQRAINQELAYLRSNGAVGQDYEDEDLVEDVSSQLDKYLYSQGHLGYSTTHSADHDEDGDLGFSMGPSADHDEDRPSYSDDDDHDEDEDIMSAFFERRNCEGGVMGDDDDICVICQDELYQENGTIATIACRHEFHPKCIARWLRETGHCPLCKAPA